MSYINNYMEEKRKRQVNAKGVNPGIIYSAKYINENEGGLNDADRYRTEVQNATNPSTGVNFALKNLDGQDDREVRLNSESNWYSKKMHSAIPTLKNPNFINERRDPGDDIEYSLCSCKDMVACHAHGPPRVGLCVGQ